MEERLRWLLLANPFADPGCPLGFCIRDASGVMRGLLLSFPSRWIAGEQKLMALASGGFFVEPQARSIGFFLFKKHLRPKGYSFFFSTTCNTNSAPLWQVAGACAVPNSDSEYILPFRLHTLLPALLAGRTASRTARAVAHGLGRCGNQIMRLAEGRSTGITAEPCRDWEKLSHLFHRNRTSPLMTADRSPEFLEWRYGRASDPFPSGVYLFRDTRGYEGWFSLGMGMRGREGQISGAVLLDAVWPGEKIGFTEILPEIIRLVAGKCDLLSIRPRPGITLRGCSRWVIRRRFEPPTGFAIGPNGHSRTIAEALDLCPADGDGALPTSFSPSPQAANVMSGIVADEPVGTATLPCAGAKPC